MDPEAIKEMPHKDHRCPFCGYFHRKATFEWCHTCRRNKFTGERYYDYRINRMRMAAKIQAAEKAEKPRVEVIA